MPAPTFAPVANSERNWMGIASLVLGVVGGGFIGLGLGIAGLRAANEGRATNRTMAIWGIVLNSTMWIVYMIALGSFGALGLLFGPPASGNAEDPLAPVDRYDSTDLLTVTEIPYGTCFTNPERAADGYFYGVEAVNCEEPHDSQVYATGSLPEQAYVSEDHIGGIAFDICFTDESLAAIHPRAEGELYADVYFPNLASWNRGDRGYVCFVWDENGPLTESVLIGDPVSSGEG